MKTPMTLLALFLGLNTTCFAQGTEHGNGGGAMVCRDSQKQITRIQMYDLYEGQSERYEFKKQPISGTSVDDFLNAAYQRLMPDADSLAAKIQAAAQMLRKNITETHKKLIPTIDANKVMVDEGCDYEQVAIWDERVGKIFVNVDLFGAMAAIDQAALLFHEATYWVDRRYGGATLSDETREFVARVFLNERISTSIGGNFRKSGIIKAGHEVLSDILEINTYIVNWNDPRCYQYSITQREMGTRKLVASTTRKLRKYEGLFLETFLPSGALKERLSITPSNPASMNAFMASGTAQFRLRGTSKTRVHVDYINENCQQTIPSDVGLNEYMMQFNVLE